MLSDPGSQTSPHLRIPTGAPADSPYALQLQRGFPGLKFEASLEQRFRRAMRTELLPQIRRNLWIALAIVVGFSLMTHTVLEPAVNRLMDQIRLAMFAPILVLGLVLVRSPLYHRCYASVCQIAAPVFGAGVAWLHVIAATHGVNLISTVIIVTIFIYFMLGMLFYAALGAALAVLMFYLIVAAVAGLGMEQILIDAGVLVSANLICAMVCHSLERANRTNFLEERLLIEMASRDGLTGIHNRRLFDEHIDRIWPQALRDRIPLALMLIDIDHFKAYNDHYGHQAGDECLRQVAWCLTRSARRPLDVSARYGGEEFAIILYDARRDHVEEMARSIQAGIEALAIEHLASPADARRLTVSIGAACVEPVAGRSHFGFIQLADEALYAAKARGRNCVMIMDKEYDQLATGSFRNADPRRMSAR